MVHWAVGTLSVLVAAFLRVVVCMFFVVVIAAATGIASVGLDLIDLSVRTASLMCLDRILAINVRFLEDVSEDHAILLLVCWHGIRLLDPCMMSA